jgi:hypothetical protein
MRKQQPLFIESPLQVNYRLDDIDPRVPARADDRMWLGPTACEIVTQRRLRDTQPSGGVEYRENSCFHEPKVKIESFTLFAGDFWIDFWVEIFLKLGIARAAARPFRVAPLPEGPKA